MIGRVRVLRPGLLTTVQDLGRHGHQREGVPVCGAMDSVALRLANLAVGNEPGAAALEVTLLGPSLELEDERLLAVTGADLGGRLDGEPLVPGRAVRGRRGGRLDFTGPRSGCRAYLAFAGGIAVAPVLGSRSTYLRGRFGGWEGRALAAGDALPLGEPSALARRLAGRLAPGESAGWTIGTPELTTYSSPFIRAIRGAHFEELTAAARAALLDAPYRVTPESDRMGYRLAGPPLELERPLELVSEAVAFGTVQLPPGGQPIVLMADRQTTGGYPRVLEVAAADLPALAQAKPGSEVRFREISLEEAQALYIARERQLSRLALAIDLNTR